MSESLDNLLKAEALQGADQDPFAQAYGPTPECFSSNDIVRMFRLGAVNRDVDHLQACKDCHGRVEAFAAVTGTQAAAALSRSWLTHWFERLREAPQPALAGAQALVHIPSSYAVGPSGNVETVRVLLLAGMIPDLPRVQVRIVGAVTADVAEWKSGERFPVLEVRNVKASGDVRQALEHHQRVTKQIVIELGELPGPRLTATANIEFTKAV